MAFTHVYTQSMTAPEGVTSQSNTYSSSAAIAIDETIGSAQTDVLVNGAFTFAQLKSIFILSTTAMTLETNSGSSPSNTISLKANVPLEWNTDSYWANPFTVDVTKFYFTNPGGTAATLTIRILVDSTP